MGDCNGDLGNSLGDESTREPNQRCRKLFELADYFHLCPVNLLGSCGGPTFDYIFVPHCLFNEIRSAKTFDLCAENTSDHLPIMVNLNQREFHKIQWSKFSSEKIHEKYVVPLLSDLSEVDMYDLIDSKTVADKMSQLLIDNSLSLVSSVPSTRRRPVRR